MFKFISERLKERTTWIGLTAFVSASGVTIAPMMAEAIISAGTAIGGLIFAFTRDKTE